MRPHKQHRTLTSAGAYIMIVDMQSRRRPLSGIFFFELADQKLSYSIFS